MEVALLALGAVAAAAVAMRGSIFVAGDSGPSSPGLSGDALIKDAIRVGTVDPLGLPDGAVNILFAQYKLETASGTAYYFGTTKSLYNRHIGSGRGEWLGSNISRANLVEGVHFVYVSPGDPDLRCYSDYYQCSRDMAQLMSDPLYTQALAGLRRGSAPDYFNALRAAGFSTQDTYATALQGVYDRLA